MAKINLNNYQDKYETSNNKKTTERMKSGKKVKKMKRNY